MNSVVTIWARTTALRKAGPWHAMVGKSGGRVRWPTLCGRQLRTSTLERAGDASRGASPRDGHTCPQCMDMRSARPYPQEMSERPASARPGWEGHFYLANEAWWEAEGPE